MALAIWVAPAPVPKPKPLQKYTIENLARRGGVASIINYFGDGLFSFSSDGKIVTGKINQPTTDKDNGKVVVMLRGSVDDYQYYPGFGTQKVAEVLAKNGYTAYAPDFLGYGDSSPSAKDEIEGRFQTYTTTLDLIASLNKPVMLWGHSNGGQIALSVLAITGKPYPTVLWNPVSAAFPYSILYYTDQYPDQGKFLRQITANFEVDYDADKYSYTNYLSNITAPILLQQGGADELVPKSWSDQLNEKLKTKNIKYVVYPGADHNLLPQWDQAVEDLVKFYDGF